MREAWCVEQTWRHLAMAHWRVDPHVLMRHIPPGLELDLFDSQAYVSAVVFSVDPFRLRGLPPIRGMRRFWQMNIRTYVRRGAKPGVWFLRLETSRPWPARLGKLAYALPFEPADMTVMDGGERLAIGVVSRAGDGPALSLGFRRAGSRMPWYEPAPDSIEAWLLNRYALYARALGTVLETGVVHRPWMIQPAEARVGEMSLLELYGCHGEPALACSAETRTARIGLPRPAIGLPYSPDNCSFARWMRSRSARTRARRSAMSSS
ncbi:DUF2071 domain-containing protein [Alicyclobacillus acidocaldarius]|uniref:DUF2071 domain-containing protein n=1 Tax=Alicyclobacillus acidocaldarius subsp. acidocaldarius (strain ATCC 27009 / DSM 446 / BCRC 14685 / JCM 5260 / KCTC 1825 / NBRC 15652 / NCIMB 11725 / NRRL B-14509 / 104-IA) TaxID=521098 RepID=C8WUE3_ALIAD|nr:DUF2071 domain-containing protein [Alicyclobacillus acidocaldarius]ACV57906.1 Protein of unknown function DUF2071 [Alicyclobacillus acidocaldarius subsp. acidocaldarius DSM 446]